jgi:hypothetical protein
LAAVHLSIAPASAMSSFLRRLRLRASKAHSNESDHPAGNEKEAQLAHRKLQIHSQATITCPEKMGGDYIRIAKISHNSSDRFQIFHLANLSRIFCKMILEIE